MTDENLSGLCGDYNHQSKDDLKLFMTGEITSVPVDFGNQWKLDRNVKSRRDDRMQGLTFDCLVSRCFSRSQQLFLGT